VALEGDGAQLCVGDLHAGRVVAVVDVAELGVSVRMLLALGDLGVRLEAVAQVVQEMADEVCADLVAERGELADTGIAGDKAGRQLLCVGVSSPVVSLDVASSSRRGYLPRLLSSM